MHVRFARLALLVMAGLLGLNGCASSARYVTKSSNGGIIAIPANTNSWPGYYHNQAEELMKAQFPDGYVVEHVDEFVTGTTQYTDTTTNRNSVAVLTDLGIAPEKVNQHQTTSYQNNTEWRIYYRRKDAPAGSSPPALLPAGTAAAVVQPVVGLTPVGDLPTTPQPLLSTPGMTPIPR
jgi:hypothetical protein